MIDGGVYDDLGPSPLLPGRSSARTAHVYDLDHIIATDAVRGRAHRTAARFMPQRLVRNFDITYTKSQDAARSRIHEAGHTGHIKGFVHTYRGMQIENLPTP